MDIQVGVLFDNNPGIQLTQGEDRTIVMTLFSQGYSTPVNLTGAVVGANFPYQGGGNIKRTSGLVAVPTVGVNPNTANSVTLNDHGFVTGDPVTVAAIGSGVLPAGLAPATPYTISVIDLNTFQFLDATGAVVTMTSKGSGSFSIFNANDVVISNASLGQVTLSLRAAMTLFMNAALAQNFQVEFTVGGKTRISVLNALLDVLNQPEP